MLEMKTKVNGRFIALRKRGNSYIGLCCSPLVVLFLVPLISLLFRDHENSFLLLQAGQKDPEPLLQEDGSHTVI